MIVFDRLWETMKEKGFSSYTLREEHDFHSDTIKNLRNNRNVSMNTLSKLCEVLDCRLEDIAEYVKD